jgi:homoserine kinase
VKQVISWATEPVAVRVPATSANLGPGFDTLGLALSLHDLLRAEVTDSGLRVEVSGIGETRPGRDDAAQIEGHLIVRAMRGAFEVIGDAPPGIALNCRNSIPQGFGLGSSAAAIIGGLLAARALAGEPGADRLPDETVLRLAADLEGHADNVAACLAGGLTIAWNSGGSVRSTRLEPLAELMPVLCVPARPLPTKQARELLPDSVSHAAAAMTASRAALLITALTSDPGLLFDATEDYLHQPYRGPAMPGSADLLAALRAANVPAVVSGAGPAILALIVPGVTPGPDLVAAIAAATGDEWAVIELPVDRSGGTAFRDAALTDVALTLSAEGT